MNAAHNPDRPQPLLLLAIALIGVFAFLQVYSVQAVLPILMHDLQASEVQVGLEPHRFMNFDDGQVRHSFNQFVGGCQKMVIRNRF